MACPVMMSSQGPLGGRPVDIGASPKNPLTEGSNAAHAAHHERVVNNFNNSDKSSIQEHLTVIEYLTAFDPGQFTYMTDPTNFAGEELFMDFQEAAMKLPPMFRSNGTRVYRKELIELALNTIIPGE